jgi:hypothetical protein
LVYNLKKIKMKKAKILSLVLFFLSSLFICNAQDDEGFLPGFVSILDIHSGLATVPGSSLDIYVGGAQLSAQYTIVPGTIRAGLVAGGIYTNREVNGLFGINTDIKIATISLEDNFGVASNIFLSLQHLWGTSDQKLIGGGLGFEAFSLLTLKINVHRDYHFDSWWISTGIGIRINKVKEDDEPFNE